MFCVYILLRVNAIDLIILVLLGLWLTLTVHFLKILNRMFFFLLLLRSVNVQLQFIAVTNTIIQPICIITN